MNKILWFLVLGALVAQICARPDDKDKKPDDKKDDKKPEDAAKKPEDEAKKAEESAKKIAEKAEKLAAAKAKAAKKEAESLAEDADDADDDCDSEPTTPAPKKHHHPEHKKPHENGFSNIVKLPFEIGKGLLNAGEGLATGWLSFI